MQTLRHPNRVRGLILGFSGALAAAQAFVPSASADLLVYEGFNYTVGSQLSGQNGGFGFLGAWRDASLAGATIQSGSLAGPAGLATSGNHVLLSASGTTTFTIWREIGTIGASGTTTWLSFLGQRVGTATDPLISNLPNNPYPRGVNTSLFSGAPGAASGAEQIGVGNSSNATDDQWSIVPRGSGGLRQGTDTPYSDLAWVVLRIDHHESNAQSWLWINPDPATEPLIATADAIASGFGATNINLIRPFLGGEQGTPNEANWRPAGQLLLDELRIGTDFASVVPEPTTYALAAVAGGLALLVRRMRRD